MRLMKNIWVILLISIVAGCNTAPEQKNEINEKLSEQARLDSIEFIRFEEDATARIELNEVKITELKDRIKSEKEEKKKLFEDRLEEIRIKNIQIKSKIQQYRNRKKKERDDFVEEFNMQVDSLKQVLQKEVEEKLDSK